MVNIPNLPTDSLYKFMAILGVILIVISMVLGYGIVNENQKQIEQKEEHTTKQLSDLSSDIREAVIHKRFINTDSIFTASIKDLTPSEKEFYYSITTQIDSFKKDMQGYKQSSLEFRKQISDRYTSLIGVSATLGVILTSMGLALWYVRIQRYQDYLVIKQADINDELKQLHRKDGLKAEKYYSIILVLLVCISLSIALSKQWILFIVIGSLLPLWWLIGKFK